MKELVKVVAFIKAGSLRATLLGKWLDFWKLSPKSMEFMTVDLLSQSLMCFFFQVVHFSFFMFYSVLSYVASSSFAMFSTSWLQI